MQKEKDFQDFYRLWPLKVVNTETKVYRKSCQKFSYLYLHSIQLVIPKTKIINLCFISLVV